MTRTRNSARRIWIRSGFCWRALKTGIAFFTVAVVMTCLAGPPEVTAAITGRSPVSPHDFTGRAFSPGGACSACHVAHSANDASRNWPRNLTDERNYFSQTSAPNYRPLSGTLLCYDCHINALGITPPPTPDNDPSGWLLNHEPQDIAFTDNPADPPANSQVGYYELGVPVAGTVPSLTNPPPTPPSVPPAAPTGGHFWKGMMGDTPWSPKGLGDKIDCDFCHEPHHNGTGANQVMLRTSVTDGTNTITIGDNLFSSSKTRNHQLGKTGREMCAGCHQYTGVGGEKVIFGVRIKRPPAMLYPGHDASHTTTECTQCHPHNSPDCGTCHGDPPPAAAPGYASCDESTGLHPQHASAPPVNNGYGCNECHVNFPVNHNTSPSTYQNVYFDTRRNPGGSYNVAGTTCNNIYCHSRGTFINDTRNNLGSTSTLWDCTTDWSTFDFTKSCERCHGASPARSYGAVDFGAPDYPNSTDVGGSLKANSHRSHKYRCSLCHNQVIQDANPLDGWTIANRSLHVDNTAAAFGFNVNPDPGNSLFVSYSYATDGGVCTNIYCHGGNNAKWGHAETIGAPCAGCHLRTNANGGDLDNWNIADYVLSRIDSDQWTGSNATGHGRTTAQGWYPWPDNNGSTVPANLACLTTDGSGNTVSGGCHAAKVAHNNTANPYRLATPNNTTYAFEPPGGGTLDQFSLNLLCRVCHDSDGTDLTCPHSKACTEGKDANWNGQPQAFKCTDCHDPHGDSYNCPNCQDYMVHANVFADSSDDYGLPSSTDLYIQPVGGAVIQFNVTAPPVGDEQLASDYVNTATGSTIKICQVCHQNNASYRRNFAEQPNHMGGGECLQCHNHPNFAAANCLVCHGALKDGLPQISPGKDRIPGNADDAPNAISVQEGLTWYNVYDGSWWDSVMGGNSSIQQGGHGDPGGRAAVACLACHNIGNPPGTHLDGTVNSTEQHLNLLDNTAHLRAFFFGAEGSPYSVQVNADNGCYNGPGGLVQCHAQTGVRNHRHTRDAIPAANAVEFGTHLTRTDADDNVPRFPYPIDSDLTTRKSKPSATDYAPCVACHNPHGTTVTDHKGSASNKGNYMLRAPFTDKSDLCVLCHI